MWSISARVLDVVVEALTWGYELLGIDLLPRKRIMGWRAKRVRVAFILKDVVRL